LTGGHLEMRNWVHMVTVLITDRHGYRDEVPFADIESAAGYADGFVHSTGFTVVFRFR